MSNKTKLFLDTEFTGLHQGTTLISIGIVSDCGKSFYAELTDYDQSQINDWLQENVIDKLILGDFEEDQYLRQNNKNDVLYKGDSEQVKSVLVDWLTQFNSIDIWSDVLAYDWVLFNNLIADYSDGYPKLPSNINYIPFDIATLMEIKGVNPDINREELAGLTASEDEKHNALWDAKVIKACYEKLIKQ